MRILSGLGGPYLTEPSTNPQAVLKQSSTNIGNEERRKELVEGVEGYF
jgi:hypothetical protein